MSCGCQIPDSIFSVPAEECGLDDPLMIELRATAPEHSARGTLPRWLTKEPSGNA
jgi:hypothetical protein